MMKQKYTNCMTIRLEPLMDDLVVDAAFEKRMSKAQWIRIAIRHSLGIAAQNATARQADILGVR
jgi:hypothetical protein